MPNKRLKILEYNQVKCLFSQQMPHFFLSSTFFHQNISSVPHTIAPILKSIIKCISKASVK